MEKILKDRGFIGKRGFKKLIFPLVELLEKEFKKHWESIWNLSELLW